MKNKLRFLAVVLIGGGTMFAQTRSWNGAGNGGHAQGAYAPPSQSQQYVAPSRTEITSRAPVNEYRGESRVFDARRNDRFDRDDHDRYERSRRFRHDDRFESRWHDYDRDFRR